VATQRHGRLFPNVEGRCSQRLMTIQMLEYARYFRSNFPS
jgi:hypothetical protein